MKDTNHLLRSALSGLFDIQAETDKIVVTAPGPLCDQFYRYLEEHHPRSRHSMFRPALELGQEIHFKDLSTDEVVAWVQAFAEELDAESVNECYHAIYP